MNIKLTVANQWTLIRIDLRSLSSIVTVVIFLMNTPAGVFNPARGLNTRITLSSSSRVTSSFRVIREIVALLRTVVRGIVS